MRAIKSVTLGATLLCAALCLASCKNNSVKPVAKSVQTVEVARRQYVPIPADMTAHPAVQVTLPSHHDNGDCINGCYTDKELKAVVNALLSTVMAGNAKLDAIRALSDKAVQTNDDVPNH